MHSYGYDGPRRKIGCPSKGKLAGNPKILTDNSTVEKRTKRFFEKTVGNLISLAEREICFLRVFDDILSLIWNLSTMYM